MIRTRFRHLKIKIKSLVAEAHIIRAEEARTFDRTRDGVYTGERSSLTLHRTGIVRAAARVALLAYGCLRGIAYTRMEGRADSEPDWAIVEKEARRFGTVLATTPVEGAHAVYGGQLHPETTAAIAAWLAEARAAWAGRKAAA